MLTQVTNRVRSKVFELLNSEVGNGIKPVRMAREFLSTANDLAGRPFRPQSELRSSAPAASNAAAPKAEVAPVVMYFDGKDHRTKKKMEELLRGRDIPFQLLDVSDDEATRSWALTQAKLAEFPLVFVAGESIGGLHELTQADVNGTLKKRVFGLK
jgi:hypothetical protein